MKTLKQYLIEKEYAAYVKWNKGDDWTYFVHENPTLQSFIDDLKANAYTFKDARLKSTHEKIANMSDDDRYRRDERNKQAKVKSVIQRRIKEAENKIKELTKEKEEDIKKGYKDLAELNDKHIKFWKDEIERLKKDL